MVSVAEAARNNAAWCDAVLRAHGGATQLSSSAWLCRSVAPSFYSNMVTLDPAPGPALDAIAELDRALPGVAWSVKDSFDVLPLRRVGFVELFRAEWVSRPPSAPPSSGAFRVRSATDLAEWEAAWGESAGKPRIFLPALLERSDIAILGIEDGGEIGAGVIANRTDGVVGVTNLFVRSPHAASLRARCLDAAAETFPDLPLVGYERGAELAAFHALGFGSLGSLRVWIKA